jgi:hypothetical protein
MKKHFLYLVLAIIIVLGGCNKPKITCKIISPKDGAEISIFEDLVIVVEATDTKSTVTAVVVSLNGIPYPGTQAPPYTTTIPSALLTIGKQTITAVAINREGDQAEASITINIVESGEGSADESPSFVTFTGGILPPSWKTSTWEVDIANGYDDFYSLRSNALSESNVVTYKTVRAPSYVEFNTTGNNFDLYIDGSKAQALVSAPTDKPNWRRWVYAFGEGRHSFKWTTTMGQIFLDAITFAPAEAPEVTTHNVTTITAVSAISGGEVTGLGNHPVIERGVCWSTSQNPTISDPKTEDGVGAGSSFTSNITGLTPNRLYYVRAYATNAAGTAYGDQVTFTTLEGFLPEITTGNVTSITATSAICGGNATGDGNSYILARGVCWSTFENPTIDAHKTVDGAGMGSFASQITGLAHSTRYYVRAYATNSEGTVYGEQRTFTTTIISLPTVTTATVTNISSASATCGGSVINNGNDPATTRGVCWSTSENPTISDSKTEDGTGTGSFTSQITGLTHSTYYYVRAYATNGEGTSYGVQRTFVTAAPLFTAGYYTISLYDSDCDGWHGNNFVSVKVGNTYVLNNITLNYGCGPDHNSFYIGEGQSVTVYFTSGSYASECFYKISTGSTGTGTVLYTSPRPPLPVISW